MNTKIIEKEKIESKKKWFYLFILMIAYTAVSINTYKIQPILPHVMENLRIDEVQAGMLIAAVSIMCVFVPIPFGFVLGEIGFRRAGFVSILLTICGTTIGALTTDFTLLLLTQIVSGIGGAMLIVIAPSYTMTLFKEAQRATAVSILNTSQTLGQFIIFNIAPRITTSENVTSAWWLSTFISAFAFLLWMLFIRDEKTAPREVNSKKKESLNELKNSDLARMIQNPIILQLMIGGFFYLLCAMCVLVYLPSFLAFERGMELAFASSLCSINSAVGIVSSVICGFLADKLGTKKWVYLGLVVLMGVLRPLQVMIFSGPLLILVVLAQGMPAGGISLLQTAAASVCKTPEQRTMAISMISTATMGATALSSVVAGFMIREYGYNVAFLAMAPVSLLALIGMMTRKEIK